MFFFCNQEDETLLHMFWDCPKTRKFWLHVQSWIFTNFTHCDNLTFTKEFIILGSKINIATDRILDLFILMAKHHIFTTKIQGTTPHLNTLIMKIKSRFLAEKYYYTVNNLSACSPVNGCYTFPIFHDLQPYYILADIVTCRNTFMPCNVTV